MQCTCLQACVCVSFVRGTSQLETTVSRLEVGPGEMERLWLVIVDFVSSELTHCRPVMAWLVLLFEGVDLFDCLEGGVDAR